MAGGCGSGLLKGRAPTSSGESLLAGDIGSHAPFRQKRFVCPRCCLLYLPHQLIREEVLSPDAGVSKTLGLVDDFSLLEDCLTAGDASLAILVEGFGKREEVLLGR